MDDEQNNQEAVEVPQPPAITTEITEDVENPKESCVCGTLRRKNNDPYSEEEMAANACKLCGGLLWVPAFGRPDGA